MTQDAVEARTTGLSAGPSPRVIEVTPGRRVEVVANLGLTPEATTSTSWAAAGLARSLDAWEGAGTLVVAGNLFDLTKGPEAAPAIAGSLDAHKELRDALKKFVARPEHQVLCLPGTTDGALSDDSASREALQELGVQIESSVDLELQSASGTRVVRVDSRVPEVSEPAGSIASGPATMSQPCASSTIAVDAGAPWQAGISRLADPSTIQRFLTSRLLYRRFARFAWWLLLPIAIACLLRVAFVTRALDDLFFSRPGPARALKHAHEASWAARLTVAGLITAAEIVALGLVLGWLGRRAWRALGGGRLDGLFEDASRSRMMASTGATVNDSARAAARTLVARGYAGFVTGATLQAELTHLAPGFFACAGTVGEVVEEHAGRLGLLPVFLQHDQLAWVELESGAEMHARLLIAREDLAPTTILERIAANTERFHDAHPEVVAASPGGESWPPPPDLRSLRNQSRRVRRWAAAAIFLAGAVDLITAITPPVRSHLHLVLQVLPLGASQAAGALVALAGVALLALARGVRRGQHRAWVISSALLAATLVLHIVRGADLAGSIVAALVLALLLLNRREFRASTDLPSMRSALIWLVAGVLGITAASILVAELALHFDRDRPYIPLWKMGQAVVERLVGVQVIPLPDRLNDFLAPSLLAIGFSLAVVALLLATRPLVDRRRTAGRAAWAAARDIVARHGEGTLDYFALRSDKQWFFHRDSLVAYAIYGGVCLVSPDPIGPRSEREQVWAAFRRFADNRGWVVSVMGAGEAWLPLYRATGMHDIYIGDEAVVDLQKFSLAGGHMKGLRQAHNRIAKYGYAASFHDPARLDAETARRLAGLMAQGRRGEFERGFSMMLGRIFDVRDQGIVLCVVTGPTGEPAAMCQFVPARGIGGFSLDLMRRDLGEHPNGLIDFALVSTIEHMRQQGYTGLSLNFAALRSVLEGEGGDGVTQRVERWAIRKMSSFLQIETLWRFNAKYRPDWLPRYVVYDTAEHLVPVVLAILRAESLSEVPVIGRVIAASDRRSRSDAGPGIGATGESLLPSAPERSEKVSAR